MPVVSISEAARIAGVARSTLYRQNKKSKLTITELPDGQPGIDLAELYRVYPQQRSTDTDNATPATGDTAPADARKIAELQLEVRLMREQLQKSEERDQVEVRLMREQLQEAQEREVWFKKQIEDLTSTIKQIEHRPEVQAPPEPPPRGWWSRFFGRA